MQKKELYIADIIIEYNVIVYNNEKLFFKWIEEKFKLLVIVNLGDFFLVIDIITFYKMERILHLLWKLYITIVLILFGLISFFQLLNIIINGPFK